MFPYKCLERIVKEKVTGFPIVPTMLAILLKQDLLACFDLSSIRYISNTAAPLPVNHIKKIQELLPHIKIFSMYGLTECKRVSFLPPDELSKKPMSVGKAIPNEEVFILDGNGLECAPDEVGELVIRGSNVMQGYWNDSEATDKTFRFLNYTRDRLLFSGDLFSKDEEGYLYFKSRKDEQIKIKGERVSLIEIENVLSEIEGVIECSVIGISDDIFGNVPELGWDNLVKNFLGKK